MQLKASTDYGMRAILYLAAQGTTCSSKDIAEDMSIPRDYLIQLAQLLRNAGIIEARPGKHGGYRLAKDPADTNVLEIMEALDDDAKQSTRAKRDARKGGAMVQEIKQVYDLIEESMDAYLSSLTVQMLLDCARNGDNSRTFWPNDCRKKAAACSTPSSSVDAARRLRSFRRAAAEASRCPAPASPAARR